MSSKSRFLKAISVTEFTGVLDGVDIVAPGKERLPLANLVGRVLSDDVWSDIDVPSFPKSSVDGYALKARSTFGANEGKPVSCRVVGTVEMGRPPPAAVAGEADCMYVPTGGPVPEGADAVVKVEFTRATGTGGDELLVFQAVVPGDGVVAAGSDIRKGGMLLRKGSHVTSPRAGVLAAAGVTSAWAFKRVRVGLFSTGNEIVEPGKPLGAGKIYDVNSTTLAAMLESAGCAVTFHGILADEMAALERAFMTILDQSDAVICTGGTSKGRGDLMPSVIAQNPATTLQVHGVRVKPGKPIIMAIVGGKPVFVLPGNPVSAAMTVSRLVRPALRRWNHLPPERRVAIKARVTERVYSEFGRLELKPAVLDRGADGSWSAVPASKGSETITTLIDADGYFEIPENVEIVERDTVVDVIPFS
ncbi:MAG: molybdopterin molybdenumtransferase MoeA [Candidatus Lokiarchaeota archaeon]|nr:molybdopterin molybdenumtransferase MoeA [Candidatus Lokiarchaeota archaeon]